MRTEVLVAEFLASCRARNLAKKTVRKYEDALVYLPGPCLPEESSEIDALLTELVDLDLAPETVHSRFAVWKTFYFWVALRYDRPQAAEWVRKVTAPRRGRKLPRVFTPAEIQRIAEACKTDRDRALVQVALDTGARVGEIAALRKSAVGDGVITLNSISGDKPGCAHCINMRYGRQETGKSGERVVPISPATTDMLHSLGDRFHIWMAEKQDPGDRDAIVRRLFAQGKTAVEISKSLSLFGFKPVTDTWVRQIVRRRTYRKKPVPLTYSGITQSFRRLLGEAKIDGRRKGPHTLRHTFATEFLRRGGSLQVLQRIMGHSKISTTQIYIHLLVEDLQREHRTASPAADLWLDMSAD